MTIDDVNKLATLARIEMSDAEKQEFLGNMESILNYIDIIKNATIEGVEREVGDLRNVMREDENPYEGGEFTDKILNQAPSTEDGFVKVKQIL